MSVETLELDSGLRIRIEYDTDVAPPHKDMDMVGNIAYLKRSRNVLGSEAVDEDRMAEIQAGIANGTLIGLPVFAYVHSGTTIRAASSNPFACPWDSGLSGYVYCERERGITECGDIEQAVECLKGEVGTFDQYLQGDIYGFVVEDANGNHLDSCWGFYGLDYCREQAKQAAEDHSQAVT